MTDGRNTRMSIAFLEKDWQTAEELLRRQDTIEVQISGFNKGGVIVNFGRLRGFVPESQLSPIHLRILGEGSEPQQRHFETLMGRKALIKVVEIDRSRNRLILSERLAP